eukprot:14290227-Ditylum_brightwellii.AAC.1
MKLQIKYAIRKFVKSKYTLDDLVQEVADPEIIPPITKFFTKKNSYIPTFRDDDDKSIKSTVSKIANMTGVSARGGAFHEDFNLGPQPGDKEGENVDDDTSANTRLTGITL